MCFWSRCLERWCPVCEPEPIWTFEPLPARVSKPPYSRTVHAIAYVGRFTAVLERFRNGWIVRVYDASSRLRMEVETLTAETAGRRAATAIENLEKEST